MKKAALYIRVSTEAQREEGYSIEAQTEMLSAFCVTKKIDNYEFYIDGGYTGSNLDRPQMQRMIKDAKEKRLSCVIVYKLDRMSRSQRDTLYLIEEVFNPNNVDFISMNESMDTSTPLGRLMLGILSAFAQLERENIRERTRMGMKERVKSGLWPGGGRIPFGYDYDPDKGVLVPNKDADTVRAIYDLYLQGYPMYKVAQIVGLKYEKLALQILKRKSNAGYILYNGVEYKGKHEPIVSLETYEAAMQMMKERSSKKFTESEHLLSGLVYCGVCGAKMRYQKWGENGFKLCCYSQEKNKPYLVKDPNCSNEKIWADIVEDAVISDLFSLSYKREKTEDTKINALNSLEKKKELCTKKLKKLYMLYAEAEDDTLLEAIEEAKEELSKAEKELENEKKRSTRAKAAEKKREQLETIEDSWEYMTAHEKQNVVRSVVKSVTVTPNSVHIDYHFTL
ncbi:MAG: recombinase family protein [Bacillota bacterium]|nr:recombinase family protein [Bacillota bacterium]